ncbi:MAG TPA: 2'-5' RNA ligase family protein [Dermatophilaceae bacterium]|nr:2'-5' RNA ligase family protein [Dermatophilaceae bacterium]
MSTYGVAIAIPAPWGPALQDHRKRFGDPIAGAIPPHVTLLPPTAVPEAGSGPFVAHVGRVAAEHPTFDMVLSGTGTFRPVSPVVFVQVSRGISSCERLESAVRSGPVERRLDFNYHPHVTVAHHLGDAALDRAFEELADFRCAFPVRAIDLYEHCRDDVWRPRRSFPLLGA